MGTPSLGDRHLRSKFFLCGACILIASAAFGRPAWADKPLRIDPAQAQAHIHDRHAAMLKALTGQDFVGLSQFVHPALGLRLSLDAWVGDEGDPVFSREQIRGAKADTVTVIIGYGDGDGEPIHSTLSSEMEGLSHGKYQDADSVSFNVQIHGGNTANNILDFYPGAIVVEYYFQGKGESADFNWSSTRFVYVEHEGVWYLSAVARDHWTI